MKKTPATMRIAKNPTRPTTPAPADFLLTASALLLNTPKKPDEPSERSPPSALGLGSIFCVSFIRSCSFVRFRGFGFGHVRLNADHPLDVDGVIVDRFLRGMHEDRTDGEREGDRARDAQPAIAPKLERSIEKLRE